MAKRSALVEQASAEKACADRPVQDETVSSREMHDVLDLAQIGVWEYDLTTGCVARSLKHDQIYGYTEGLGGWTLDTLLAHVAPEHRDAIRMRFEQCRAEGVAKFDCRIIRADGSFAWISSHGHLVRDALGAPVRIAGIAIDVTQQKVVEQTLEFERQLKETFVSTLAHELRQPLSALLAAVEVLRLAPETVVATRMTELMRRQIGQMDRVVEDLIDATRWARGKVTLRKQRIDARDVIRDASQDVSLPAAERGLELNVATIPAPLWVDADPQRLQQVLSNLLRNAIKCTEPGGRIALAAERGPATLTLRVTDTGRGIEADALTRIFDLFSQVPHPGAVGLGIGLSVVKEIVTLHDGRIEARSEGPGRGSEFIVTLPLALP